MTVHDQGSTVFAQLEKELGGAKLVLRSNGVERDIGLVKVKWNEVAKNNLRPDIIVNLKFDKLTIFGLKIEAEIPILVEIEKGGIQAATADFMSLAKRPLITTTAVVLGGQDTIRSWQAPPRDMDAKLHLYVIQKPLD